MNTLELIPFRLLLDRILAPAKHHARQIFLPIAVPMAACGVLATFLQLGWFKALASNNISTALPMIGGVFSLFFIIIAVYGLGFSALLVASLDAVAGRPVKMGRAWSFALAPRVFGTLFVVGVCNTVSFLMCLAPALYVAPILTFVLPVMVEEQRFGVAAIRRSVELANTTPTGRWLDSAWPRILVFLIVGAVISYAVSLCVQLPFLIVQQLLLFREAASGQIVDPATLMSSTFWIQVPSQILAAFANTATWMYWTFGISLLYRETRRRQEGDDLWQAIDALTGTAA